MDQFKSRISAAVDSLAGELFGVSDFLYDNPEIAYQEYKACAHLSEYLSRRGFKVETKAGGVDTAFVARPAGVAPGSPRVAILAEYDALPGIGHGCGHNVIAAAGLGAFVALSGLLGDQAGQLMLVGTPAEEGGGGKIRLAEAGVFDGVDAAMMIHPGQRNLAGKDMLGRVKFSLEFLGKTSHASSSPDKGVNALDALVSAYVNINSLRQRLRPDGRIHGIITNGGQAPNIIPDYASGLFYVRAGSIAYRDQLFDLVTQAAEGAALGLGAKLRITVDGPKIDPFRHNPALEKAAAGNMTLLGIELDEDDGRRGSSDIANLSQMIPCIHPVLAMVEETVAGHSVQLAEATKSERGRKVLLGGAKLLGMTACDFLTSPDLRSKVAEDFRAGR